MAVREIIVYGHPTLRQKARSVEALTPDMRQLIADMRETVEASDDGVGLAAPQIAEPVRLIVVDIAQFKGDPENPVHRWDAYFNPEIVEQSDDDEVLSEGCLSLPDIRGEVYRARRVRIRARNERFEPVEFVEEGFPARVFQHEIDHLDGVLFVDRMSRLKRVALTAKLSRLRRQGEAQAAQETPAAAPTSDA